jgi:hypothetical protein
MIKPAIGINSIGGQVNKDSNPHGIMGSSKINAWIATQSILRSPLMVEGKIIMEKRYLS